MSDLLIQLRITSDSDLSDVLSLRRGRAALSPSGLSRTVTQSSVVMLLCGQQVNILGRFNTVFSSHTTHSKPIVFQAKRRVTKRTISVYSLVHLNAPELHWRI